jgi:hypothetical protein
MIIVQITAQTRKDSSVGELGKTLTPSKRRIVKNHETSLRKNCGKG